MTDDFEEYVYHEFVRQMRAWPVEVRNDIYIGVLFINLVDDDPRFSELSLDYNTLSYWRESIYAASDEAEAKWNYAFWLQNDMSRLCESSKYNRRHEDLKGIQLRDEYLKSRLPQYNFSDAESKALLAARDEIYAVYADSLFFAIIDLCGSVLRRLHESCAVTEVCGRAVPIVVEMLNDTGDELYTLSQIEATTPAGLVEDYVKWKREFS